MTKRRFARAVPHGRIQANPKTGNDQVVWFVTFKTFLPTAEPQPWHTFFKRLRLDPVEHDSPCF
jgi:hypothetical protein